MLRFLSSVVWPTTPVWRPTREDVPYRWIQAWPPSSTQINRLRLSLWTGEITLLFWIEKEFISACTSLFLSITFSCLDSSSKLVSSLDSLPIIVRGSINVDKFFFIYQKLQPTLKELNIAMPRFILLRYDLTLKAGTRDEDIFWHDTFSRQKLADLRTSLVNLVNDYKTNTPRNNKGIVQNIQFLARFVSLIYATCKCKKLNDASLGVVNSFLTKRMMGIWNFIKRL